ncbi:MAG TPA: DNA-directed RNA polymerase subunit B'' [Acidobacteriota bacterium]|nr:DNA-directed RNA polymerase subunit B'' [Acidobacteriota bacterium]
MNKPVDMGSQLLTTYFTEVSPLNSNINSFNDFIERRLAEIIKQNSTIEPTIIPSNIDKFVIKLDKIWVGKPEITEADGSKRDLYPLEARLRNLSYSAPIFLEVSVHINDIQRESFTTQIGNMPIMLKSKFCHLSKLNRDQLIAHGEDGDDPGGYFIINGTEKVLIHIEDLSPNKFMIETKTIGPSKLNGRIFSEYASYKIPHTLEKLSDGITYLSFTRMKRVPLFLVIKSLGMTKDEDIVKAIDSEKIQDEIFVNLYDFVSLKKDEDAQDALAKRAGITQTKDIRLERVADLLDRFLLPHLGIDKNARTLKAKNLAKYFKQFALVSAGYTPEDDKDHYMNKRIKMAGDLLADLFETNLRVLIDDLIYNFQRIVKRGKFPSIKVIIRDKLLTSRIYSAMATGSWVGGRKGISQRMQRWNYLETISHLQRVVSPLSVTQENFEARALHPTHLGRLCPVETPEGTNIGLRKNLALLSEVSLDAEEKEVYKALEHAGLKRA